MYKKTIKVELEKHTKFGITIRAFGTATANSDISEEHAKKLAKTMAKQKAYDSLKEKYIFLKEIMLEVDNNNIVMELQCISYLQNIEYLATPTRTIYYIPSQIKTAYSIPSILPLTNVRKPVITILIAYHYANLQSDFNIFCSKYNLPPHTLQIEDLGNGKTNNTSISSGWAKEECLDVQWSYAMNPNAIIRVVAAKSNSYTNLMDAVKYASTTSKYGQLPDIISMSWGSQEFSGQTSYDSYFSNKQICYLAASGDSNYVSWPSSSPNVLSCGGTSLYLNSTNNRTSETTWTSAGCGVSAYTSKPSYQLNISSISQYAKRCIPDLACVANPATGVAVIYKGNTYVFGGTSVATPLFAGVLSLSVQNRLNQSKSALTTVSLNTTSQTNLLQSILYNNNVNNFYDVPEGSSDGIYTTGISFDVPTGLGVPIGDAITNIITNN